MQTKKIYTAIGLMSGTSLDGIDIAMIQSDGKSIIENKKFAYYEYDTNFKQAIKNLIYGEPTLAEIKRAERDLTLLHAKITDDFLQKNGIKNSEIDIASFHGHTILHLPNEHITWQIGNKDLFEAKTGIKTINNLREFDVARGGQGAPLVPIYHFFMIGKQETPVAVLNIGGISNITYIPSANENEIEAFDVCFGNAPFDDLICEKTSKNYDDGGNLGKSGNADFILADRILQNEIFYKKPPKSFDRDDFVELLSPIKNLKIENALATYSYMHAKALKLNIDLFEKKSPKKIFVCGGGRKNYALMDEMKKWLTSIEIKTVEDLGLNGDAIEAEAFAFLAIRFIQNLPISFAKTTGIVGF